MPRETLKQIDILRHELKALRYLLDNYHVGKLSPDTLPPREDFQSKQGRIIYDAILAAPSRDAASKAIKPAACPVVMIAAGSTSNSLRIPSSSRRSRSSGLPGRRGGNPRKSGIDLNPRR